MTIASAIIKLLTVMLQIRDELKLLRKDLKEVKEVMPKQEDVQRLLTQLDALDSDLSELDTQVGDGNCDLDLAAVFERVAGIQGKVDSIQSRLTGAATPGTDTPAAPIGEDTLPGADADGNIIPADHDAANQAG